MAWDRKSHCGNKELVERGTVAEGKEKSTRKLERSDIT